MFDENNKMQEYVQAILVASSALETAMLYLRIADDAPAILATVEEANSTLNIALDDIINNYAIDIAALRQHGK